MKFSILFMLLILVSSMFTAYLPASAAESQIPDPNNSNQNDEKSSELLQNSNPNDAVYRENIGNSIIKTRLPFIENQGQVNDQVKYYAETFAGTVYVTDSDLTYRSINKDSAKAIAIKEKFLDGTLSLSGIDKSSAIVNYFKGTQENWKTGIPTYDSVSLGTVWPNIDVQLKAYGNNVEKIFTVRPQGNVSDIRLTFDGINDLSVSENEELVVNTFLGQMFLSKPVAYQEIDGKRYDVDISYRIIGSNTYGFSTLSYDPRYDLVIDPLIASTFIGGTGYDSSYSVALDGLGNVYITGETQDAVTLFPTTPGVYDVSYNSYDVFVSKFNPDLSSLLASTFVGGTGIDVGYDVALDGLGNVYVVGETCCTTSGFPTTLGAYDTTQNGSVDVFVSKFNPDLSSLLASTFVGGASNDVAKTIDLDDSGNVYIAGQTNAVFQMYPTTSGAYDTTENGNSEAFVSKFNPALSSLVASTFLGGTGSDSASGIIVDSVGNVYVTGSTRPPTFPSNSPSTFPTMFGSYDTTYNGGTDAFVSKFNAHLSVLLSSTLIGGSGSDNGAKLAIDNSGNVYVAGGTTSLSFPTTLGAYDTTYNGGTDAFVSKLDANLLNLFASSLIGGTNYDEIYDMSIDSSNNVYVTGGTDATDFPTTSNAYDSTHNGDFDAFITKFNSGLSDLLTSTFIGNAGYDESRGIAFDNSGNVYVAGGTASLNFPTTLGAYDTTHNGDFDAFVSKFSFGDHITDVTITSISPTIVRQGVQTTITAQVIDLTSPRVPPGEILFSDNGAGGKFVSSPIPCIGSTELPLPSTCTVNYIPNTSGTITITATYDQPGYVVNHDSGDLIVEPPIGTIVTFVDPPTHIAIGQDVGLVITIAADTLAVLPTGNPALSDNALGKITLGACSQDAPNAIECVYNYRPSDANPPGERVTLTAVYDEPGFVRSEKSVDVIVNLDKTTTSIISIDPPSVTPGDTVTIIANVIDDTSHIYPPGDLTFSDGGAGGNFENLSCVDSSTQDNLRQCVVFYTTNPAGQQGSTVNIVASYSEPQFTPSSDSKQILIQDGPPPPPPLTRISTTINVVGGSATSSDFTIKIDGQTIDSSPTDVEPGTHTVSFVIPAAHGDYTGSFSGDCDSGGIIQVNDGQTVTCNITFSSDLPPPPPPLTRISTTINVVGGSATSSDFTIKIDGQTIDSSPTDVEPGTHTVSFVIPAAHGDYTGSFSGDCDSGGIIQVNDGQTVTCNITFSSDPSTQLSLFANAVYVPGQTTSLVAHVNAATSTPQLTNDIVFSDGNAGGTFNEVKCVSDTFINNRHCSVDYTVPSFSSGSVITITASYNQQGFKPSTASENLTIVDGTAIELAPLPPNVFPGTPITISAIVYDLTTTNTRPTGDIVFSERNTLGKFLSLNCFDSESMANARVCLVTYVTPSTIPDFENVFIKASYDQSGFAPSSAETRLRVSFDTDDDGIDDSIDDSTSKSTSFSDIHLGGTTYGWSDSEIKLKRISDLPNPKGVLVESASFQFESPLKISACDKGMMSLGPEKSVEITCGSVIIDVIEGPIQADFTANDGTIITSVINSGNGVTFDPDTHQLIAHEQNLESIIILINGQEQTITPGQILDIQVYCDGKILNQLLATPGYNIIDNRDNHLGIKIRGTNGNDLILLSDVSTKVSAKQGNDCVIAGSGNDQISGGKGNDQIFGQGGNDKISGNDGNDKLNGGDGDDRIWGGKGTDNIDAGNGNDKTHGNQDNDTISGGDGNDWLSAGIGDDAVTGGLGDDKIFGRQGNDNLSGNEGIDRIHAGQGNDALNGGLGEPDRCHGGQGVNTFAECEITKGDMAEEEDLDDEVEDLDDEVEE